MSKTVTVKPHMSSNWGKIFAKRGYVRKETPRLVSIGGFMARPRPLRRKI